VRLCLPRVFLLPGFAQLLYVGGTDLILLLVNSLLTAAHLLMFWLKARQGTVRRGRSPVTPDDEDPASVPLLGGDPPAPPPPAPVVPEVPRPLPGVPPPAVGEEGAAAVLHDVLVEEKKAGPSSTKRERKEQRRRRRGRSGSSSGSKYEETEF